MQPQEAQPPSNYLAYVGLVEGLREIKTSLGAWVLITALGYVGGFVWGAGESFVAERFWGDRDLPRWVWAVLVVGAFSWMLRGQTLHIPRFTFRTWVLSVAGFAVYVAILEYAPWWASWPLISALLVAYGAIDELNALGRENYEERAQVLARAYRKGPPEGGPVIPKPFADQSSDD